MKCPFCEKDVQRFKANSHVVPKWMYKPTFENNRGFYSVDLKNNRLLKVQDGTKLSFICDACEDLFAKDDTYASLVFVRREERSENISRAVTRVYQTANRRASCLVLTEPNFRKIQKFVFGVFIRGYLAGLNPSNPVLGEKHFRNIRRLYFDESNLDDMAYPILIFKVDPKDWLRNIVHLPSRGKDYDYGSNIVGFTGGGFEFYMIVQSHKVRDDAVGWRLKKEGELVIPIVNPSRRPWEREAIQAARALARIKYPNHKEAN